MYISNTILISVASGIGVLLLVLIIWIAVMHSKFKKVLLGKNAHNLEDTLVHVSKDMKDLKDFTKEMESYLTTVEKRLKTSIQSVETVRFNPFQGTGSGGNNSFSTAFITEKGNGVVLTSMYARDRISMFAKPVKNFASEYELSDEEKDSIKKAQDNLVK